MPLKETLQMLREREQSDKRFLEDRPKIIREWKQAITSLFLEIRNYLAEHEKDGLLSFSDETISLSEESLGTYQVPVMKITAGPAAILVQPIGRIIVGALGRVDMYRQGRAGEQQRIMLLRMQDLPGETSLSWKMRMPTVTNNPFEARLPQHRIVSLSREILEEAVDFLLN